MPDDAALSAMGFGDLVAIAFQCGLHGDALRDETSARDALRRYREANRGKASRGEAVEIPLRRCRAASL